MNKYNGILITVLTVLLSSCGPQSETGDYSSHKKWSSVNDNYQPSAPYVPPRVYPVEEGLNPERVRISCPSGDCPEGVGLLLFTYTGREGKGVSRCTGTLISPNQVMTNSHCTEVEPLNTRTGAYFILPKGDGVIVRNLNELSFEKRDKMSGVGRDLAVWTLDRAVTDLKPRRIARVIPAQMEYLVSYVINSADYDKFKLFQLDKRQCRSLRHHPLLAGGVQDYSIGLALYDCKVQQGNSGAPVFSEGDLENVQLVLNTIWNSDDTTRESLRSAMRPYFFQLPPAMTQFFAMAERVHCLDMAPLPAPDRLCEATTGFPLWEVRARALNDWYASYEPPSRGIVWGARPIAIWIGSGENRRAGVAIVPVPLCVNKGSSPDPQIQYYQGGFDGFAGLRIQLLEKESLRSTREHAGSGAKVTIKNWGFSSSYEADDNFTEAADALFQPHENIPACIGNEFELDREKMRSPPLGV